MPKKWQHAELPTFGGDTYASLDVLRGLYPKLGDDKRSMMASLSCTATDTNPADAFFCRMYASALYMRLITVDDGHSSIYDWASNSKRGFE